MTLKARQLGIEDGAGSRWRYRLERGTLFAKPFEAVLGEAVAHAPSWTLRGGTREILRGIIARGLNLR